MKAKSKKTLLIWSAVGLVVLVFGAVGMLRYFDEPYKGEEAVWLYLPEGTTRNQLADTLRAKLGKATAARTMRLYTMMAEDSAKIYGAYRIEPGASSGSIARRLHSHTQTPVRVVFNNVRTLNDLAERVAKRMDFTPRDFVKACNSVLADSGFKREEYVAAFLPDTYEFYWNASAESIVEKLLKVRNDFWTDKRVKQAKELGLTPVEVATIASIAEEETNDADERAVVARLYLNRLRSDMKLQADPTVKFAVGDFGIRRVLRRHLEKDSPYNTYKYKGLPPGPIRVAAAATMRSFLEADDHDYLYMCAREDFSGRHNFAKDYATHEANARRYQRALDERGIKK